MAGIDFSAMQPWEALFRRLLWPQLDFIQGMRVLDFGSGEGATAAYLAKSNSVVAVEPSSDMLKNRVTEPPYEQLQGSTEVLQSMPDASFDAVICHNVLEYIDDKAGVLHELLRVLRPGGVMSVVKHNRPGRVMQMAVLLDDFDKAHALLSGEDSPTSRFGMIRYYEDGDVTRWLPEFCVEKCCGLRTFWDLQQNQERHRDPAWQEKMLELERRVSETEPYRSMAFFHHLIGRKIGHTAKRA